MSGPRVFGSALPALLLAAFVLAACQTGDGGRTEGYSSHQHDDVLERDSRQRAINRGRGP